MKRLSKKGQKQFFHYHVKRVDRDESTERRRIHGVASTGAIDRANESIDPKGWDLKNFKKNPVFLWAHNSWEPPIGKIENIRKEDDQLLFEAVETEADYPLAKLVFDQYEAGELRAFSVGFIPHKERFLDEEGNEVDQWGRDTILEFTKTELLEISAVPVPCNQEALQLMFAKGLAGDERHTEPAKIAGYKNLDAAIVSFKSILEKEIKEGRVLSGKNRTLIQDAASALQKLLDATDPNVDEDKALNTYPSDEIIKLKSDFQRAMRLVSLHEKLNKALLIGVVHKH